VKSILFGLITLFKSILLPIALMMQVTALLVTTKSSFLVGYFPMPNMVNVDIKHVHVEESLITKLCLTLSRKNSLTKSIPILTLTLPLVLLIPLNLLKQLGTKFTLVL